MFGIFRKVAKVFTPEPTPPAFLRCYSGYGDAMHIRVNDDKWISLCGREIVKGHAEATVANVIEMIPRQHSTSYFCSECASQFTGIDAETIRSQRIDR